MFRGANYIKVDGKGRVALPTRLREAIAQRSAGNLVVTVSHTYEPCLVLYPLDEWELAEAKVNALPSFKAQHQELKRFFIGYATDVQLDKTGRVLLPPTLREFAQVEKGVYLVGQGQKFEIWSQANWEKKMQAWIGHAPDPGETSPELEILQL